MPRAVERRLRLLEAEAIAAARDAAGRRAELRFYAGIAGDIREVAAAAGIDTATIAALRRGDEAAAELVALGETPELALADQAVIDAGRRQWRAQHPGEPDPRDRLVARLQEVGGSFPDGETPGPDGAILEWYAWAVAQPETPLSRPP